MDFPSHIGIIMDGNGRWAEKRGKPRVEGHREGSKTVRRIVREARKRGVKALTLYAFSEQNWSRPGEEVDALMELLREFLVSERGEILENGIRLHAIGKLDRLPAPVREVLEALRGESHDNGDMVLTLALSYGGQEEIVDAARRLAEEVKKGALDPRDITLDRFASAIPSVGVGEPDLVIRTGGEQRISNFLLFGLAYAELFFTDALWPDFTEAHLHQAIASFSSRERRYGLAGSQLRAVPDAKSDPSVDETVDSDPRPSAASSGSMPAVPVSAQGR